MDRRHFLVFSAALAGCRQRTAQAPTAAASAFNPLDATAAEMSTAMQGGKLTATRLLEFYLDRIARFDRSGPKLRSVLELNPDAKQAAAALDQERVGGKTRGPLHGIPVLIKDNVETADHMMTTAGSLALEGWYA